MCRIVAFSFVAFTVASAGRADDKPAPSTEYYLGESKMTTPAGQTIRTTLSLVKRVLKPAESKIEEHVMTIDEKAPAKPFVVFFDVTGSKFTLVDLSKTFSGEGELKGDAWKWKEWKSTSKLPGGATVVSEDKMTDRGLTAKKSYAGADGKIQVLFDESMDRISAKTYEILYAKLAPAEGK